MPYKQISLKPGQSVFFILSARENVVGKEPFIGNLSQAIKWINVGYSMYFNRKRRRFGHLFQGRFKAVLVDADEYLKHLSRYIQRRSPN